jgi:hypothetical protein
LSCAALALAFVAAPASADVFINEIHYDDATSSGDTGERIEVVATAGETLSAYRIYLYNGSTPSAAVTYDNDLVPAGSLVSCGAQVRIATVSYASNGIQNGPNDGIALVNGAGQVVQFISYEGVIKASNGPAAGRTSVNLPVSESGSDAAGRSLRLTGSGTTYANFSWQPAATASFGSCNAGQTFAAPNPPPVVTSTTPVAGATDFPAAGNLAVGFSESVSLASGAFTLACSTSGNVALTHATSGASFPISTNTALHGGETCTLGVVASKVTDAGGAKPVANTTVAFTVAAAGPTGYYSHVNTSSPSQLRCSLHDTIKGHTAYPYSGGTTNTWTILEIADEDPNNSGRILDAYRNRSYLKVTERASSGSGLRYNREHTWPNSLGFGSATGNLGLPYAPYTDTHMLYLTDATWNADRGNKPYADCSSGCGERVTEANNGVGGGSGVYPGNSNWVQSPDGLIDIGANLTHDSFDRDRDAVLQRARDAGVARMIITGASREHSPKALALAQAHPGALFATAGVHPHHAVEYTEECDAEMRALHAHPEVVAVGECGLDYFRDFSPRPAQRKAFERQLQIAVETAWASRCSCTSAMPTPTSWR